MSNNDVAFYPIVTYWGKQDKKKGIYMGGDKIRFVKCIGEKENESCEIDIDDVAYVSHLAKYKLFVLEGAAVNDPRNLFILSNKNEKELVQINIFRFKKSQLVGFLKALMTKKDDIKFDQVSLDIINNNTFRWVNWEFFKAILRGLQMYFFILVVYIAVAFVRYIKRIIVFAVLVVVAILLYNFIQRPT